MGIEDEKWKPPVKAWHAVSVEAYKLLYERAKERLEDVLSESESITNKSIKMLSALAAFIGFFIGLAIKNKWSFLSLSPYIALLAAEATLLIILLMPKEVRWRGIAPKVLFPNNLDNEEDLNFQEQMLYYSAIVIIQDNIDYMLIRNGARVKLYTWVIILFLILFISIVAFMTIQVSQTSSA